MQSLSPTTPAPTPTYQFDNALWIGFHGGYGMFVDNLDATHANNTEDRWLRDEDGEYLTEPKGVRAGSGPLTDRIVWGDRPIENPQWKPTYIEERILDQPDYEAVLCHDCAHDMCAREPWLALLLNPHGSHAHKTEWKDAHPDHWGWDYDRHPA